jgi:hypothetical protein
MALYITENIAINLIFIHLVLAGIFFWTQNLLSSRAEEALIPIFASISSAAFGLFAGIAIAGEFTHAADGTAIVYVVLGLWVCIQAGFMGLLGIVTGLQVLNNEVFGRVGV